MKLKLSEIIVAGLLCGWCAAQDKPSSTPQAQPPAGSPTSTTPAQEQPRRIAPGSVIPVELSKTVDAKKAKVGDEVDAKVPQDMKAANGEVVVPKDTRFVGHVTEAQPRTKDQKESQIGIAFDKTVMKDGTSSPLPMSIQAVIVPQNPNADNSGGGGAPPSSSSPSANSGGSPMGGRSPQAPPQPSSSYPADGQSGNASTGGARPPITANTQGVIGIPNYELSAASDPSHGSVVRSEKGNVKLESGTMLLLRVNQ